MNKKIDQTIIRVMDANFNRAKEGLRVCEDVCRFVWDDVGLARRTKMLRHALTEAFSQKQWKDLVLARNIEEDVGKSSTKTEMARKEVVDIFFANCQRVKESVRVLEEFAKLVDVKLAEQLKNIRYRVYVFEQKAAERC